MFRTRPGYATLALSCTLIASSWIAGCDNDGSEVDASKAREALAPVVEAGCEWLYGCCEAGERGLSLGPFVKSQGECSARILTELEAGGVLPDASLDLGPINVLAYLNLGLEERRVRVDDDAVLACADSIRARDCNPAPDPDAIPPEHCTPGDGADNVADDPDGPCDRAKLFEGRQELGEECNPVAAIECEPGLGCAAYGDSGVCVALGQQGATCFDDDTCAADLICDFQTGTCKPGSTEGGPCEFSNPDDPQVGTEIQRCASGLICNPETEACVAADCAPGMPCSADRDCPVDYVCNSQHFRCLSPALDEGDCQRDVECESGFCDRTTETCQPKTDNGGDCSDHDECNSGFCNFPVCASTAGLGDECSTGDDAECSSGFCNRAEIPPVCSKFAEAGDDCSNGLLCDPEQRLACVQDTCRETPLDDGLPCTNGAQCRSGVCWQDTCDEGTPEHEACDLAGTDKPCARYLYCKITDENLDLGECTALRGPGESCETDDDCWGSCRPAFGRLVCDAQPPVDSAWCDGE